MTREQRNAEIAKKIDAYTTKFASSKSAARKALIREGLLAQGKQNKGKKKPLAA